MTTPNSQAEYAVTVGNKAIPAIQLMQLDNNGVPQPVGVNNPLDVSGSAGAGTALLQVAWLAIASGTGYNTNDLLTQITEFDIAVSPATYIATTWYNETQSTVIAAPLSANIIPLSQTANSVAITNFPTKQAIMVFDSAGNAINSLSAGTGQNGLMTATGATNFYFSTVNTSTTQLAASATFPGAIESALSEPAISINMQADQQITLQILQYADAGGTRLVDTWTYVVASGAGLNISRVLNGNYLKVTATNNGGSTTTTFNLNVAYGAITPATQLGNTPVSLSEINGTALNIGQQTAALSLPTVVATGGIGMVTGQGILTTAGTAQQLGSNALLNGVVITANINNTGTVTIGNSSVNNTITGSGNGYRLAPGQSFAFSVSNTNVLWWNGTVTGDTIDFAGN